MLSRVSHMTVLSLIIRVMNASYKRAKRLSQALVHVVTARASSFTDKRASGLPVRAIYKHFKKFSEHTSDKFSDFFQLLLLEVVIIQARDWNFVQPLCLFVCQFTTPLFAPLSMSFNVVGPRNRFGVEFLPPWQCLQLQQQKLGIRTFLCTEQ